MLKPFVTVAAVVTLSACSGSPIKQITCMDGAGKTIQTVTIDPETRAVYEYDSFSETLIPFGTASKSMGGEGIGYDFVQAVLTPSGKVKISEERDVDALGSGISINEEIDLKALTYKRTETTSKSLLKRVEGLQGAELKAALDTNLKLMKDHDYLLITTETTEGTCKYVKPFSTVVARE